MTSKRKRVLSRVLAGLAALALVIASLAAYVEQTLFDSKAFANRAVSVLDDEAVQEVVADAITDTAVEKVPNAVAARPLIESCLLYTSPSPRDRTRSRMPSSA